MANEDPYITYCRERCMLDVIIEYENSMSCWTIWKPVSKLSHRLVKDGFASETAAYDWAVQNGWRPKTMEQELLTLDQANALLDQAVERVNAIVDQINALLIYQGKETGRTMHAPAKTLQEALAMLVEYDKDIKRRTATLTALVEKDNDKKRLMGSTDEYADFWIRRFAKDLNLEVPK